MGDYKYSIKKSYENATFITYTIGFENNEYIFWAPKNHISSKVINVYFDNNTPVAFVSIISGVIKNVYSIKDEFLIELLEHISKETSIKDSIVTKAYKSAYESSGLVTSGDDEYKNFIRIRSDVNNE